MKYLSVCSGIEAATVAWHPLGWTPVGFGEIEKFPCQVLAHHYPDVTNFGDMTKFKEWSIGSDVNVLVGGTPCQSFSVAGLRKGLDDPRGNLMLTYLAIAKQYRPNWLVWENVPGVLSSNGGRDFGSFLGGLAECGYGFAYRVLDAQYFGVAQRRRRVFVVGYLGDWRLAAAVLFERHSLSGHPAPSREKRQEVAGTIKASIGTGGVDVEHPMVAVGSLCARTGQSISVQDAAQGHLLPTWPAEISSTLDTTFGTKMGLENQHVNAGCPMFVPAYGIPGNWIGRKPENGGNATEPMYDIAPCLTKADQHGVAQPIAYAFDSLASNSMKSANPISGCNEVDVSKALDTSRGLDPSCNQGGIGVAQPICLMDQGGSVMNIEHDMTGTLRRETHGHEPVVMQAMAVRRLTPVECERLQGFPDNYTDIKSKNKPTPDGPRYKALGNSMAVPVMAWIGQRIQEVEAICKQNK